MSDGDEGHDGPLRPWWASPSDQPIEPAGPEAGAPAEAAEAPRPAPSRYGSDPHLGSFPYNEADLPAYVAPPAQVAPPEYTVPENVPPPSYPAPAYAPPSTYAAPAYAPPPTYTPPAYAPPPSRYAPPSSSGPSSYAPPSYPPPTFPAPPFPTATPYGEPVADPRSTKAGRRSGWPSLFAVAGIAALIGALVAGGLVAATKKTTKTPAAAATVSVSGSASAVAVQPVVSLPSGSVAQTAATLLPSVVSIIVTSGTSGDEGTGIVLTADGSILTNNHVVESAASSGIIAVTLNDGRTVKATIVGRDPTTDLAVIKAAGVTNLHPATLGQDSSLVVGQQVIAIGSPLGLSNTVTSGIVSSLNRPVCTQNCDGTGGGSASTPTVLDAIQTDAAINPGNSGGPLVDMSGKVVGVNSAIATLDQGQNGSGAQSGSIGVGFSIPIDEARRVVDELEKTGHANHALLGIGLQDSVDAVLQTPNGAKVVTVSSGGPAAKAGIQVNDIIVKFDTRTIVDADSLIAATHAAVPNSTVTISYYRSGHTSTAQLTLGSAASS
jgi:putative serine protease PepD